jgi:hypothetical protein
MTRGICESFFTEKNAHVAQSVEHFLGKEEVTGSNPVVGFPDLAHRLGEKVKRKFFRGVL